MENVVETKQWEQVVSQLAFEFVRGMVEEFMSHPKDLVVEAECRGKSVAVEVSANAADVGKIVGKGGAIFHSMRSLLRQFALRNGIESHYYVKDNGPKRHLVSKPKDTNVQSVKKLVEDKMDWACAQLFSRSVRITWSHNHQASRVCIALDKDEPGLVPDIELRDALGKVFMAIGRFNGHEVYVNQLER